MGILVTVLLLTDIKQLTLLITTKIKQK